MSNNYSDHEELFAQLTPEQKRESAQLTLDRKRALNMGFAFSGVHASPEHEAYDKIMSMRQSQGTSASTSHTVPQCENESEEYCDDDKEDIQYKSASVFSPTNGRFEEVTVIEDSACRVGFIAAAVAKRLNLAITQTPSIEYQTWAGAFTSNRQAQVTWIGKSGRPGTDWFYIAPETGPPGIEMAVGTQFTSNHPDAFENRKQLSMLTVAAKMKVESVLGILVTVVASLLPICSVVALFIVQSNGLRLGMIAIFSACFSLALALMTNARRIEVFAATAAFAAVNVVFLTNSSSSCPA